MKNERKQELTCESFIKEPILPYFKRPKVELNFEKARSSILKAIQKKDYNLLSSWVEEHLPTREEKDGFFSKHGHNLLNYILSYCDLNALIFINKAFSNASINVALQNNNYNALNGFFLAMGGTEMFKHDDELHRKIRVDKFKMLLIISEETLKTFMSKNKDSSFMTVKIKEDYIKAEEEVRSSDKPLYKY